MYAYHFILLDTIIQGLFLILEGHCIKLKDLLQQFLNVKKVI